MYADYTFRACVAAHMHTCMYSITITVIWNSQLARYAVDNGTAPDTYQDWQLLTIHTAPLHVASIDTVRYNNTHMYAYTECVLNTVLNDRLGLLYLIQIK